MKTIKNLLFIAALLIGFTSCDYLDIVPDETPSEKDAFEDSNAAERYMYSCYSFLPNPREGASSLDLMTGDEVVTAFEHETFASFPKGNYTASNTVISYWNTFFQGLRQCYILLSNIDKVPNISTTQKEDYKAQTHFLIGYYHFLLMRCYGPILLVKEEPTTSTSPGDYLGRSTYDECIQFIVDELDIAASGLPNTRSTNVEYGLATKLAAKAIKAKALLYAASPLFNGNSAMYSNFKNPDGTLLMPQTYDANKWAKAKTAYEEVIREAEGAGYGLYTSVTEVGTGNTEPSDPTQRLLRFNILEAGNKEIVWADTRTEGAYSIQNKSIPYCFYETSSGGAWNGVAPTWAMLNRFYTKNGLPIQEDPQFNRTSMMDLGTISEEAFGEVGKKTLNFNINREPRFYSWVAFQGSFFEISSANSNGGYGKDPSFIKHSGTGKAKLVCDFVLGGNTSRGKVGAARTNNYAPTGYLNKKGIHPGYEVTTGLSSPKDYPWPIVRMAELYLSYAEACVETNDLATAKTYLNKVRTRAGIPTVEQSWEVIAGQTLNQAKMREIVRQERMIELYLENQNFWDMRRWLLADKYFNQSPQGMNVNATTIEGFSTLTETGIVRRFDKNAQYLLPIPASDVNKNQNLVQNPGY